ncbi:endonuclease MutS2 [Pediococcus stilesii]|uniref:DNA mismatch repair protein MutS2 n=1 Tax=Pediococcus stilesii TaxID=331679 RepID=A0A0R2L1R3_9LACO|nr:hypothetical protein [Pediococcus stilesii]KRN92749.1 DNA mismatch repair protein MutS2 [Pediococcus stilesii]
MNQETLQKLQFDRIINDISKRVIGEHTKERLRQMKIATSIDIVKVRQQETSEARLIVDSGQHVPFMGLIQINRLMIQVEKGIILAPDELIEFADFLRSNRMIQNFFEKNKFQAPLLSKYGQALPNFLTVEDNIYEKIQKNQVADSASKKLRRFRQKLKEVEAEIEVKLQKFLRNSSNQTMIQERLIVQKEGRLTVPIKSSFKNKIDGAVIDQSRNGQTVFVEPQMVNRLNEQIENLKYQIEAEEYQVLAELTGSLSEQAVSIKNSIDAITMMDLIFARAKYGREYDGITPRVNKDEQINIIKGRHPFLGKKAVPLNFNLGKDYRGLVITGANAGGKTVVLKTVGLLTLMMMFGLQIPADSESELAVFDDIFVDMGDQQNLDNALSTFSGHMQNIASILRKVNRNTLILLDEIGSGTEPNEGAGLAIAIMESLYQKGGLLVATTHYGEIKNFAKQHEDFMPALMKFDQKTLTPKYQLQIGQSGDSQALWIARKMKMSKALIQTASKYIDTKNYANKKTIFSHQEGLENDKLTSNEVQYQKGDRVQLTFNGKTGLVFEDDGQSRVQVYVDRNIQSIIRRRIKLVNSATELYPNGYDLDQLFSDFHERKEIRDLERGSKIAQKKLDQSARERRNKKGNF